MSASDLNERVEKNCPTRLAPDQAIVARFRKLKHCCEASCTKRDSANTPGG